MALVIGLTGGIGSGKSAVADASFTFLDSLVPPGSEVAAFGAASTSISLSTKLRRPIALAALRARP